MCLAVPGKILEIDGPHGILEVMGNQIKVFLSMIENPKIGDYVLVHAGMAIGKISAQEARETTELLEEMARALDE